MDFNLSSTRIWSLWRSEDGETSVYSAALYTGGEGTHWVPVILEPVPDTNFTPDTDYVDPRQAYLQHIFYPARFPLHIISKALSVGEIILCLWGNVNKNICRYIKDRQY